MRLRVRVGVGVILLHTQTQIKAFFAIFACLQGGGGRESKIVKIFSRYVVYERPFTLIKDVLECVYILMMDLQEHGGSPSFVAKLSFLKQILLEIRSQCETINKIRRVGDGHTNKKTSTFFSIFLQEKRQLFLHQHTQTAQEVKS